MASLSDTPAVRNPEELCDISSTVNDARVRTGKSRYIIYGVSASYSVRRSITGTRRFYAKKHALCTFNITLPEAPDSDKRARVMAWDILTRDPRYIRLKQLGVEFQVKMVPHAMDPLRKAQ